MTDPSVRLIRFGAYKAPIGFDDCDELLTGFRSILRGWDISEVPPDPSIPSAIRFSKRKGRHRWRSTRLPPPDDWTPHGPKKIIDAVADFHYRFLDWHSQEFTDQFCLHCAAVRMNDGLVIFPSVQKSGKSTIVVELAMRGYRVYCDDVLPVDTKTFHGIAMGIVPRIRLPVPPSVSPQHKEFVESRIGLSDRFAAYLNLRDGELANFGESGEIRAVLLLDRQTEPMLAQLSSARRALALSKLINQNYAKHMSPQLIFDGMLGIVDNAELRSLEFSDVSDAADLIEQKFGG